MNHTEPAQHHAERIFDHYNNLSIAAGYGRQEYITPCERMIFDTYIKHGAAILDIGVGGGRTSPCLARYASRYVGIDFAPEMVRLCHRKYPQWEYCEGSAVDLSSFQNESFDVVVMSYNVLDDLIPDESRWHCLRECHRVLGNDGLLIFSSHNPRAIIVRPEAEIPGRHRSVKVSAGRVKRLYGIKVTLVKLVALVRLSLKKTLRYGFQTPFWRGQGYMLDGERLMTHYWMPQHAIAEVGRFGFRCIAVQGDDYPQTSCQLTTDWYYYVCRKMQLAIGKSAKSI
ncbi:MAG: class I SAM-dependent methyltransferase [Acidobacteriia bacterium]|nr:class I SAM-dependent methyltransferase [Terriglobia bacterium]